MFIMPGAYAMMAQSHMHLYGTKPEHFAQVSVKAHKNGVLQPLRPVPGGDEPGGGHELPDGR